MGLLQKLDEDFRRVEESPIEEERLGGGLDGSDISGLSECELDDGDVEIKDESDLRMTLISVNRCTRHGRFVDCQQK